MKVMLVCGFCISFGVFSSNIRDANNRIIQVGIEKSSNTQARAICRAGLNQAMYKMATPTWFDANKVSGKVTVNNIKINNDTVSYVIDKTGLPSNQAHVVVTAKSGGNTSKLQAIILRTADPTYYWYWYYNKYDAYGTNYNVWKAKRIFFYPEESTLTF